MAEETKSAVELPDILTYKEFRIEDGKLKLRAGYSPTVGHSEHFVEMTGDDNPIHKEHPKYHETISPGFMQTSAAIVLINYGIRKLGLNPSDFPFSYTDSEMKTGVVTGLEYRFEVEISPGPAGELISSVNLAGPQGTAYSLERISYGKKPDDFFSKIDIQDFIHAYVFIRENPLVFGKLIGSESSESNLYAVSASSSVVSDAVRRNVLNNLEEDVAALYTKQEIYSDTRRSLDLKKGLLLFLFLSGHEKFGKRSEAGQNLDMKILAMDHRKQVVYLLHAPLAFPRAKILELQMRKALRSRS